MQGNGGTKRETKEYGGNGKNMERERHDGWEGEESGGINGERYDEWYYGYGRGEKEEEYKRAGNNRYRQKKISG